MRQLLFLGFIFCTLQASPQSYSISFTGTGLSTVKVQNLTTGIIVNVPAGDVLLLSTTTDIPEANNMTTSGLKVYPNPITEKATLEILPPVAGDALISVYDLTGKAITRYKGYLGKNSQKFSISGLKIGLHIINVKGNGYLLSEKLISNGKSNGIPIISMESNYAQAFAEKESLNDSKGIQATVDMAYKSGERLKYYAISGNNSTVMTDIPSADKTITFTFTECKDGDNNYYPVVKIGALYMMAENLKTTKYNDGSAIPLVTAYSAWNSLTTAGYCWYNNDEISNKPEYGALYNYFTVRTGNLCPTGWHVPTHIEWTAIAIYLGGESLESLAGTKLKETGTEHWNTPNQGATNETGFTALPGGYRLGGGSFSAKGYYGYWWSSTMFEYGDFTTARFRSLGYDYSHFLGYDYSMRCGFSVRCLRD